ncbi:MAG: hypothetical protein QM647_18475 [Asticcacaulis sp.]|uniref:hypothetical protein n=1 Tax=Asticcacaulis sp. TaxID=1872648 RepID=UPI0039E56E5F
MRKQTLRIQAVREGNTARDVDVVTPAVIGLARLIGRQMAREYLEARQDEKKDTPECGVNADDAP